MALMFWKNFYTLCQKNKISANAVCAKLGLSTAAATHWKNGAIPKGDILLKLAQYFNVTTDYLLTGKEPQNQSETDLTDDEIELLSTYRKLPLKGKTMTRAYAYNYLEQAELRTLPIAARDGGILSHSLTKEEIQQAEENTPELPPRKQPPKFDL